MQKLFFQLLKFWKLFVSWLSETKFSKWYATEKKRYHSRPAALRKAIRQADRLCRKNKKRVRVYFIEQRYRCYTRQEVKDNKRSGKFNPFVNVTKMEPLCFYDTLTGPSQFATELLNAKKK